MRLAKRLALGEHQSQVLRTIIFRESGTHPEVREHVRTLREGLLDVTERVLDNAVEEALPPVRRRQAAHTFVAVMLDEANARRFDGRFPTSRAPPRSSRARCSPPAMCDVQPGCSTW